MDDKLRPIVERTLTAGRLLGKHAVSPEAWGMETDMAVEAIEALITARVVSELEKVKTEHTTTHKYFNCVEYLDNRIATLSPDKGRRE